MFSLKKFIFIFLLILIIKNENVFCWSGYNGYEGGISSGTVDNKTVFDYKEIQYITGSAVTFEGTLTIKKSKKTSSITTSYSYDLEGKNGETLAREISFTDSVEEKENNQDTHNMKISGTPKEVIKDDLITYTLESYDFMQSVLVDKKPAINYSVGNIWGSKKYKKESDGVEVGEVAVDISAELYGYDQYWSNTESIMYNFLVKNKNIGNTNWSKNSYDISISSSIQKQLTYAKNLPNLISFSEGYVLRQFNNNILKYNNIIDNKIESFSYESYPIQKRLISVDFPELDGHWSEENIKKLYGLEILNESKNINPENNTLRGDYIKMIYNTIKEIPNDPLFNTKTTSTKSTKYTSTFKDVPNNHPDIKEYMEIFEKGIVKGDGNGYLNIHDNLKFIDALVILVRAIGLNNTEFSNRDKIFKDENDIPSYGKNAVDISYEMGLIEGDTDGYLNPNENLSNARSSAIIIRFVEFMSEKLYKDYRKSI
jgi:hypothetical protein